MSEEDVLEGDWKEMPTSMQVMMLQKNVKEIGVENVLKKAVEGELEVEDLMEP